MEATHADLGADRDVIPVRVDRPGWAEFETAGAASLFRPLMCAKAFGIADITGLIELASEQGDREDCFCDVGTGGGVCAHIALSQLGGWKKRRTAREIKNDIGL